MMKATMTLGICIFNEQKQLFLHALHAPTGVFHFDRFACRNDVKEPNLKSYERRQLMTLNSEVNIFAKFLTCSCQLNPQKLVLLCRK